MATFDLGLLADITPYPYRVQCEQWRLNQYLREQLKEFPHAEIHYGVSSVSVTQDADKVALTVADDKDEQVLEGRYLIGSEALAARSENHSVLNSKA